VEEYMQVLEEELQQCHDERRALTEENEELRKRLHARHPDDTHTDIETTGI